MPNSKPNSSSTTCKSTSWPMFLVVLVAMLIYSFEPGTHALVFPVASASAPPMELVGIGKLLGPEDIAYDATKGLIYTGCADGWIKTVSINDLRVNKWVFTGGRPLGLTVGNEGQVIVADARRGLLRVSANRTVELLSDGVEGLKFRLTDAVHVAEDGMIYFTDASYKYRLSEFIVDILEGEPHGRLMSFDPKTRRTRLLADNLYFANGVVVSPDQNYVIVCEAPMKRCNKYHIRGDKIGIMEKFVELPGMPDKISYDGNGRYHIALTTVLLHPRNAAMKYPFIMKALTTMKRFVFDIFGGIYVVDLDGKPVAHYYGLDLLFISSGIRIGNYLYCGSVLYPYITRFTLDQDSVIDFLHTKLYI